MMIRALAVLTKFRELISEREARAFMRVQALITVSAAFETVMVFTVGGLLARFLGGAEESKVVILQDLIVEAIFGSPSLQNVVYLAAIVTVLSSVLSLRVAYINAFFAVSVGANLSSRLFNSYLETGVVDGSNVESAPLIKNIIQESHRFCMAIMQPLMVLNLNIITFLMVTLGLLYFDPTATLFTFGFFVSIYLMVFLAINSKLKNFGRRVSELYAERMELMIDVTQGFKDIKNLKVSRRFTNKFEESSRQLTHNLGSVQFLAQVPKIVIEGTVIMVLVSVIAFSNYTAGDPAIFTTMAIFGVAAIRLLPVAQKLFHSASQLVANVSALHELASCYQDLKLKRNNMDYPELSVQGLPQMPKTIRLEQIVLLYPNSDVGVGPFSFELPLNKDSLIVGPSGVGKSTLGLFLSGYFENNSGKIFLDEHEVSYSEFSDWLNSINYISQDNYLFRGNLIDNLTCFDPSTDSLKLRTAADAAELTHIINDLPDSWTAEIGEDGDRLSGGQRQRLILARALYHGGAVLLCDEITSALDKATAKSVLNKLSKSFRGTVFIHITHDPSLFDSDINIISIGRNLSLTPK